VHGVFPPNHKFTHLHENFNFNKLLLETVRESLYLSCRSELTRGNFATLGPSGLQPPFNSYFKKNLFKFFKLLETTGQISDLILHFINLAKSFVFSKQSFSFFFIIIKYFIIKSFIPKLEIYFAEFLQ